MALDVQKLFPRMHARESEEARAPIVDPARVDAERAREADLRAMFNNSPALFPQEELANLMVRARERAAALSDEEFAALQRRLSPKET